MKSDKILVYLFALGQIKGLGPVKIKNLFSRFPSLSDIFYYDVETLMSVRGISRSLANSIREKAQHLEEAEAFISEQLQIAEPIRAKLIPITCEEYPELLRRSNYSPEIIYAIGDFEILSMLRRDCIGIGGTRLPTEYGENLAYKLGRTFARSGWSIISGLAKGIDAAAHRGSLDGNGRTVAVVGSGIDVIYPKETIDERNRIHKHGLIVSEYPFGTRPTTLNLKKRNKVIVGLSEGLVVVQTGIKGGAYNAVRTAREQRKPVFAVRPSSEHKLFEGNFDLINNWKAISISGEESVNEIIRRTKNERPTLL